MIERAAETVPLVWIAFSIIDVSAWWVSNQIYLNRICANTLEFQAFVIEGFAQTFSAYILQFEQGIVVRTVQKEIAKALGEDIFEVLGKNFKGSEKMVKKYEKKVEYFARKYSDRFLVIMAKGWAVRIWQSVMINYDGSVGEAEQCAFHVLVALTVYHPKTIHPLRIRRRGKDFFNGLSFNKEMSVHEINIDRKSKLKKALSEEGLRVPKETRDMVLEYWDKAKKRNAENMKKQYTNQRLDIPDDIEDDHAIAGHSEVEVPITDKVLEEDAQKGKPADT